MYNCQAVDMRNCVYIKKLHFYLSMLQHIVKPIFSVCAGLTVCFFLTFGNRAGAAEQVRGLPLQGDLMVFKAEAGTQLHLDGMPLALSPAGYFAFGFHRDDSTAVRLDITFANGDTEQLVLTPQARSYDIQRIDNLPTSMVTPPQELLGRIKQDRLDVKAARAVWSEQEDVLVNGFDWPVWGRISGIYGSQRILNGKPRQPHYGIDIAAAPGLVVRAPADGKIVMAKDLYYTGGTIIIDHGYHLNSTYSHLTKMIAPLGTDVRRGDVIGTVGSTGRSTGPHLDWRINWKHKRLDPLLLAGPLLPALPAPRPF